MRIINTSNGPVEIGPDQEPSGARHTLNTSHAIEENLTYTDEEPEILAVLPAGGWQAVIGTERVPLVAFVALDSGRMYGVPIGEDGRIDLVEGDVEKRTSFSGYALASS